MLGRNDCRSSCRVQQVAWHYCMSKPAVLLLAVTFLLTFSHPPTCTPFPPFIKMPQANSVVQGEGEESSYYTTYTRQIKQGSYSNPWLLKAAW